MNPLPFLILVVSYSAAAAPPLGVDYLYHPIGRSLSVRVDTGVLRTPGTMVLLTGKGEVVGRPIEVKPGAVVDLNEVLPEVWELEQAGYLQLMRGETPVGSALVVEPMRSRLVPQTRQEIRESTNSQYTKIVGWKDEYEPPPPEVKDPGEEIDKSAETIPESTGGENPSYGALCTGVRIYAERDVVMHTSLGDMRFALTPEFAPHTAWNFRALCEGGFYRNVIVHRVVPFDREGRPFVIQGGDPTGTGEGGAGTWLPFERSELGHDFGVISMARADDPDSAGCQFFVCLSREGTARLDGQYCAFGYAVGESSRETILKIAAVELADVKAGRPAEPPVILGTELVAGPRRFPGYDREGERVKRESDTVEEEGKQGRVPR